MNKNVGDILPANIRRILYIAFAVIGVGFGATQTAFVSAEVVAPVWLTVAFQVYLYVGGAFGLLAATNTVTPSDITDYTVVTGDTPENEVTAKHADV